MITIKDSREHGTVEVGSLRVGHTFEIEDEIDGRQIFMIIYSGGSGSTHAIRIGGGQTHGDSVHFLKSDLVNPVDIIMEILKTRPNAIS